VQAYYNLYWRKKKEIRKEKLFHGTGDTDPAKIYTSLDVGFDPRWCVNGMWGKGVYFATDSAYSAADRYCYDLPNGNSVQILAEVILGDFVEIQYCKEPGKETTKIMCPPKDNDSNKGETKGHEVFMIYYPHRAYPLYLVEFSRQ